MSSDFVSSGEEYVSEKLKIDKGKASDDTYGCTFDFQKALPYPKLWTSITYYKRNLYVLFGIHSFNDNVRYMYFWDASESGTGSEDISSIIGRHLKVKASTSKTIILYSDSFGQNRNIKMTLALRKLVNSTKIAALTLDRKFMVSGHSFLPNDAQSGVIEAASRRKERIYIPEY